MEVEVEVNVEVKIEVDRVEGKLFWETIKLFPD